MSDLISKQAVIDAIFAEPLYKTGMKKRYAEEAVPAIFEKIKALPPVTPQPKIGHWTYICNNPVNGLKICKCSNCEKLTYGSHKYCPTCGAKMVVPQESEGK